MKKLVVLFSICILPIHWALAECRQPCFEYKIIDQQDTESFDSSECYVIEEASDPEGSPSNKSNHDEMKSLMLGIFPLVLPVPSQDDESKKIKIKCRILS